MDRQKKIEDARVSKLKLRLSSLKDKHTKLTYEVRDLKKEIRAEQFVNGSLRSLIYGSSPFYGVFQISTLLNWVETLVKEKQAIEDELEEAKQLNVNKEAKKFKQKVVKGQFRERGTGKVVKEVQWVYSEN
jgi:chaperonin cofactor prefoldin